MARQHKAKAQCSELTRHLIQQAACKAFTLRSPTLRRTVLRWPIFDLRGHYTIKDTAFQEKSGSPWNSRYAEQWWRWCSRRRSSSEFRGWRVRLSIPVLGENLFRTVWFGQIRPNGPFSNRSLDRGKEWGIKPLFREETCRPSIHWKRTFCSSSFSPFVNYIGPKNVG